MKYFLFDIGHVLVDFDQRELLDAVSKAAGLSWGPLTGRDLEMHDGVEKGDISDTEWVDYLNQALGISWTLDDLIALWMRMFTRHEEGHTLFDEAISRRIPVYLLSNIAQHHIVAIENNWPGIFDGASGCFFSCRIGVRKPHPDIYRHVLRELSATGDQCFFIDDLPENIETARAFGIHAHQYLPEKHEHIRKMAGEFFGW